MAKGPWDDYKSQKGPWTGQYGADDPDMVPNPDPAPDINASTPGTDASRQEPFVERTASGFARGVVGDVVGLGRLIPGVNRLPTLNPGGAAYEYAEAPDVDPNTGRRDWGRTIGNVIGAGAPMVAADVLSGGALTPELGAGLAGRIASNAIPGAIAGAIQPTTGRAGTADAYKQTAVQAAGGGLLGAVAGEAVAPAQAAVNAARRGIRLGYGSAGPFGRFWENQMSRLPGFNRMVRSMRAATHGDAQQGYREAAIDPLRRIPGVQPGVSNVPGHAGLNELSNEAFRHYARFDQELERELRKSPRRQNQQLINQLRFRRGLAQAAVNNVKELQGAANADGQIFPEALLQQSGDGPMGRFARQMIDAGVPANEAALTPQTIRGHRFIPWWWIRHHPVGTAVAATVGAPEITHGAIALESTLGGHVTAGLAALGISPSLLYAPGGRQVLQQLIKRPEIVRYLAQLGAAQAGQAAGAGNQY